MISFQRLCVIILDALNGATTPRVRAGLLYITLSQSRAGLFLQCVVSCFFFLVVRVSHLLCPTTNLLHSLPQNEQNNYVEIESLPNTGSSVGLSSLGWEIRQRAGSKSASNVAVYSWVTSMCCQGQLLVLFILVVFFRDLILFNSL